MHHWIDCLSANCLQTQLHHRIRFLLPLLIWPHLPPHHLRYYPRSSSLLRNLIAFSSFPVTIAWLRSPDFTSTYQSASRASSFVSCYLRRRSLASYHQPHRLLTLPPRQATAFAPAATVGPFASPSGCPCCSWRARRTSFAMRMTSRRSQRRT